MVMQILQSIYQYRSLQIVLDFGIRSNLFKKTESLQNETLKVRLILIKHRVLMADIQDEIILGIDIMNRYRFEMGLKCRASKQVINTLFYIDKVI